MDEGVRLPILEKTACLPGLLMALRLPFPAVKKVIVSLVYTLAIRREGKDLV